MSAELQEAKILAPEDSRASTQHGGLVPQRFLLSGDEKINVRLRDARACRSLLSASAAASRSSASGPC
jgi:hypothetical protein